MVDDALAPHLGGVRGEHRHDQATAEHIEDRIIINALSAQPLQRFGKARAVFFGNALPVFGEIGEQREEHEAADKIERIIKRKRAQPPVAIIGAIDAAIPVNAGAADIFGLPVKLLAAIAADNIAEHLAEKADIGILGNGGFLAAVTHAAFIALAAGEVKGGAVWLPPALNLISFAGLRLRVTPRCAGVTPIDSGYNIAKAHGEKISYICFRGPPPPPHGRAQECCGPDMSQYAARRAERKLLPVSRLPMSARIVAGDILHCKGVGWMRACRTAGFRGTYCTRHCQFRSMGYQSFKIGSLHCRYNLYYNYRIEVMMEFERTKIRTGRMLKSMASVSTTPKANLRRFYRRYS